MVEDDLQTYGKVFIIETWRPRNRQSYYVTISFRLCPLTATHDTVPWRVECNNVISPSLDEWIRH